MAFTGATSYYGIPYGRDGDLIEEPDNQLQSQMADWLLQAASGVAGNGVISEGTYAQAPDTGVGNYVYLNPSGGVSIKASFQGALARSPSTIVWEGLATGNFYYLYLEWNSSLFRDPTSFTTTSTLVPYSSDNNNYLFLATYDLTGGYPGILDSDPDGKRYATGFTDHMAARTDPHSPYLVQTNLTVSGSCWVGLDNTETLRVEQTVPGSLSPLITLVHTNPTTPLIKASNELIIQDVRMTTQLSETGESSFDNGKTSIVAAINDNTGNIGAGAAEIALNTAHRTGDGSDHADVATNTSNISSNTSQIGTNTSNISNNTSDISDLDTDLGNHLIDLANPHATDIENLGSGTLAELNGALTDAVLDDSGDPRDPNNHASNHTDGTDDIQSATNAQKGLATAAHITAIEANTSHAADTNNPHATDIENLGSGTLAELNGALTDAVLDDSGDPRDPNAHASNHTDGTDDIQNATNAQKGLATAAHITDIESNNAHRGTTSGNPHQVKALETTYDNSASGLSATNVKDAIDELAALINPPVSSSSSSSSPLGSSSSSLDSSSSSLDSSSSSS